MILDAEQLLLHTIVRSTKYDSPIISSNVNRSRSSSTARRSSVACVTMSMDSPGEINSSSTPTLYEEEHVIKRPIELLIERVCRKIGKVGSGLRAACLTVYFVSYYVRALQLYRVRWLNCKPG